MKFKVIRDIGLILLVIFGVISGATAAESKILRADNTSTVTSNTAPSGTVLVAHFRGAYRNETLDQRQWRGDEHFDLWVHADGSHTLNVITHLAARSALFDVNLRSDSKFNPLEAFVRYWNQGAYKGSGHFVVEDGVLQMTSTGPTGRQTAMLDLPASWTLGAHPVSADGWHTARFDRSGEALQTVSLLSIDASADISQPVGGRLVPLTIEFIGEETIEVPAGQFATERYRLAGVNDIWVAGLYRTVIKSEIPLRNLRYVLTEWRSQGLMVEPRSDSK